MFGWKGTTATPAEIVKRAHGTRAARQVPISPALLRRIEMLFSLGAVVAAIVGAVRVSAGLQNGLVPARLV
jgi:hypothetical protein